jgi:hypothetical protein
LGSLRGVTRAAGTFAVVDHDQQPVIVMLVDNEQAAEEIAFELRRRGRRVAVEAYDRTPEPSSTPGT